MMQSCKASLSRLPFNLRRAGLFVLLLTLGLYMGASSAWAANTLEQIDFVSVNGSTRLYAHADAALSYKTVELTPQRLVLDFDNVEPADTIRTNFSSAPNIYSVALRRLDASHLRLTVQGSELTEPLVGFRPLEKNELASSVTAQAPSKAAPKLSLSQSATTNTGNTFTWPEASAKAASLPEPALNRSLKPALMPVSQVQAEASTAIAAPALHIDYMNLKQGLGDVLGDALPWLKANQNFILQLAILGLLFTGLGLFILLKVKHLKPQTQKSAQGRAVSGWRHGLNPEQAPIAFRPNASPVGLGGLNSGAYAQAQLHAAAQQVPRQQQQQQKAQGAVALNTALGQYARQQAPSLAAGLKTPVGSAAMAKARLQQEQPRPQQTPNKQQTLRFSEAMDNGLPQKRPVTTSNRQTTFTAKAQQDVANPEVLSFLRSVAEKMEQESTLQPSNAANASAFRRSIRHLPS
jgi:hypothetical protein